jgi:hypothetical protein
MEHNVSEVLEITSERSVASELGRSTFDVPVVSRRRSPTVAGPSGCVTHLEFIEDLRMQQRMLRALDVLDSSRARSYLALESSIHTIGISDGARVSCDEVNNSEHEFSVVGPNDESQGVSGSD